MTKYSFKIPVHQIKSEYDEDEEQKNPKEDREIGYFVFGTKLLVISFFRNLDRSIDNEAVSCKEYDSN